MEKIFEGTIRNAENNELLIKVSALSWDSFQEELSKRKWLNFAEDRPEVLMPDELEDEEELEPVLPEDNLDKELDSDILEDNL